MNRKQQESFWHRKDYENLFVWSLEIAFVFLCIAILFGYLPLQAQLQGCQADLSVISKIQYGTQQKEKLLEYECISQCCAYGLPDYCNDFCKGAACKNRHPVQREEQQPVRKCVEWEDVNRIDTSSKWIDAFCSYTDENGFLTAKYSEEVDPFFECINTMKDVNRSMVEKFKEDCYGGELLKEGRFSCMVFWLREEKQVTEKLCTCWSDEPCSVELFQEQQPVRKCLEWGKCREGTWVVSDCNGRSSCGAHCELECACWSDEPCAKTGQPSFEIANCMAVSYCDKYYTEVDKQQCIEWNCWRKGEVLSPVQKEEQQPVRKCVEWNQQIEFIGIMPIFSETCACWSDESCSVELFQEQQPTRKCVEYSSSVACDGKWKPSDSTCFELGEKYLFDVQIDYNTDVIKDVNSSIGVKVQCPPICDGNLFYPCTCWSDEPCAGVDTHD